MSNMLIGTGITLLSVLIGYGMGISKTSNQNKEK